MKSRAYKKMARMVRNQAAKRKKALRLMEKSDIKKFDAYASTPNGSARLVAFHDAVSDADDTLEAVDRAIVDGDLVEACKLIALGRESLAERITELKDLL